METGVWLMGIFFIFLDFITQPLFWFLSRKPSEKLLPIRDALLVTSAVKIAELIRNKKITSQHVVEVFIERVKEVNTVLNAVVEDRFGKALLEAKQVDELLQTITDEVSLKKLQKEKPFLGVPITIKESCSLEGLSLCGGSLPRMNIKATRDGQTVSCIRASGAIPLLVSTTPEYCLSWETNNLVTGITKNPYNLNHTPGGSSGGEAALISSGASLFGLASDVAGSIRVPAMFCGIFGHKPTPGVVSIVGHFPSSSDENFSNFLALGPLTRYAEDLEPLLYAMAGKNAERISPEEIIDLNNLKVTYMLKCSDSISMGKVDDSIQNAIIDASRYLKTQFSADVQQITFEDLLDSVEMSISVMFSMSDIPNLLKDENDPKKKRNLYFEILKAALGVGQYSLVSLGFYLIEDTRIFIPKSANNYYIEKAGRLKKKIIDTLGSNGVFLYPTFPQAAMLHNQVYTKAPGILYTMIFNTLGLPSTHVPLGLNSDGLPIGMQIVGAPNRDRLCIAVARELEKGFGGWVPPFQVIT